MISLLGLLASYVMTINTTSTIASGSVALADEAFYVAEAGLQWVLEKEFFNPDTPLTSFLDASAYSAPVSLGEGSFTVRYANAEDSAIDIIVTGEITRGGQTYTREVKLHIEKSGTPLEEFSALTGGNIIGKGFDPGDSEETLDEIPAFDFDYYKQRAQDLDNGANVRYIEGNLDIEEGEILGIDNPGDGIFYYVTGKVNVEKNTVIYGTIIAENFIDVHSKSLLPWKWGDNTFICVSFDIDDDGTYENMPALVSQKNIFFSRINTLTIKGLVYSEKSVTFLAIANINLNGLIIAGNHIAGLMVWNDNINPDPDSVADIEGLEDITISGGSGGSGNGGVSSLSAWTWSEQ